MFVLVFGLLSFLAIYRGPLNVWGLGSGIVALLAASGMNPVAAMVALRLDSNVQAVCDPTNSHNVWVSDFTKVDVNEYLKKTILWIAASTLVGLIVASFFVSICPIRFPLAQLRHCRLCQRVYLHLSICKLEVNHGQKSKDRH